MSLIETRNLYKEFNMVRGFLKSDKIHALSDVNIKLEQDEIIGVVGASGSGKSTLARLLVLLYRPTSGEIIFHDEDVANIKGKELRKYRSNIQMVFQDPYASLDPFHNVDWHIRRPLIISKYSGNISERINELLSLVKLDPPEIYRYKFPHEMSGGQRQRVYMARALAMDPKILIADEPVSMLDVSLRVEILDLLLTIKRNMNIGIIYITHDLNTVSMVTDRIYVLNNGRVVESGYTSDIMKNPTDQYTRKLISAAPDPYKKIEV